MNVQFATLLILILFIGIKIVEFRPLDVALRPTRANFFCKPCNMQNERFCNLLLLRGVGRSVSVWARHRRDSDHALVIKRISK